MSNETINKKWESLLNSFNVLLESTSQNTNFYFLDFLRQEKKITKYYRKKFPENKINFNDAKKELNLALDINKFIENMPKPDNFNIISKKYRESLISFILKIKNIDSSIICNNIFKNKWNSLRDLLNIIKIIYATKDSDSMINKLFFKELYSILDRTIVEFCDIKSRENIKNLTVEKIYSDPYLEIFFTKFIKSKTKKNNFIIFKNYSEKNNEVTWENKKFSFFNKLNLNPMWQDIKHMRNDLEHSISTFHYINNEEMHFRLITSIELLIGFNFYLMYELDNSI